MARAFLHTQPIKVSQRSVYSIWHIVAAVFVLKLILLGIDGQPKVLLGDSASYVYTALTRWVPSDRSFTYGLFLRALTKVSFSFHLVVFIQTLLSAASAAMVGFALERYVGASKRVALCCALLCAVEPLQLVYERFILTEALSTFLFAAIVTLAFRYLTDNDAAALLVIPLIGTALVSIRVAFLPQVLATSVLLPFLSPAAVNFWKSVRIRSRTAEFKYARTVLVHLILLGVLTSSCLYLYRSWYGKKIDGPPAYIEESGLFIMSDFAPILQPPDFVDPDIRRRLFEKQLVDLHNHYLRTAQRFAPNGLSQTLLRIVAPDHSGFAVARASDIARAAAIHAVRRDPAGFVGLVEQNLVDYFSWADLHRAILFDQFRDQPIPPGTQEMFKNFGFDVPRQPPAGLTMLWAEHSGYWCMFLILLPPLASIFMFVPNLPGKVPLFFLLIYAWMIWGVCTVAVEGDAPRYLTGLAWISFLILGVVWTGFVKRGKTLSSAARVAQTSAAGGNEGTRFAS